MKLLPASPWDLITSTDKKKQVRFDARKCWEAGAFVISTFAFAWTTVKGDLTEWFFFAYMSVWVGARWLRDREQRLNGAAGSNSK